jgi:hypothetical protein
MVLLVEGAHGDGWRSTALLRLGMVRG